MKNIKRVTPNEGGTFFHSLPCFGDGIEAFLNCKRALRCNWEGLVTTIHNSSPTNLPAVSFRPIDKGYPPIYGCFDDGSVTCSIGLYRDENRGEHFQIERATHTEYPG